MRAYVGVTDHSWYEYLADRPWLNEVNFCCTGDQREFRAGPGDAHDWNTCVTGLTHVMPWIGQRLNITR